MPNLEPDLDIEVSVTLTLAQWEALAGQIVPALDEKGKPRRHTSRGYELYLRDSFTARRRIREQVPAALDALKF